MQIPRPSDNDKERFTEAMAQFEGVQVRAMFGNLGAFINGNSRAERRRGTSPGSPPPPIS